MPNEKELSINRYADNDIYPSLTDVLARAPEEVLNEGNITGVLDLTGLTAGVHQVSVKTPDEKVSLDEELSVEVKLE